MFLLDSRIQKGCDRSGQFGGHFPEVSHIGFLTLEIIKRRLDSFYGPPNFQELLHLTALYFSITDSYLHTTRIDVYAERIDDHPSVMLDLAIS